MNAIPGTPIRDRYHTLTQTRRSRYRMRPHTGDVLSQRDAQQGADRIEPRFLAVGDTGVSVQFGTEIDPLLNEAVTALDQAIAVADIPGIVESVPSFRSLLV